MLLSHFINFVSPYPTIYESAGPVKEIQFSPEYAHKTLWLIDHNQLQEYVTHTKASKFINSNIGDLEWWDLKRKVVDQTVKNRFITMIFPWGVDLALDAHVEPLLNFQRPVFNPMIGIQSAGYAQTFLFNS